MHNLAIYIGTSARDILQYRALINSIKVYNVDNIPVFTCVNDKDYDRFTSEFADSGVTFIKDGDVYNTDNVQNVWYKQQLIKMNFWRLGLTKHMIQIDSDSFFIKNFRISDFMVDENTPYTVFHENKELKEFFSKHNLFEMNQEKDGDYFCGQGFAGNSTKIREVFNTSHIKAEYDYGHPPCIWSNKVWEMLYTQYVEPNNLTYEKLLEYANSEQQWYGETLIALNLFPIFPRENYFKTFHYQLNQREFLAVDKLSSLKYNYHGICLQSNWCPTYAPEFKLVYEHFFDSNLEPKRER